MQVAEAFILIQLDSSEAMFVGQFVENTAHPRQRVRQRSVRIEDYQWILQSKNSLCIRFMCLVIAVECLAGTARKNYSEVLRDGKTGFVLYHKAFRGI